MAINKEIVVFGLISQNGVAGTTTTSELSFHLENKGGTAYQGLAVGDIDFTGDATLDSLDDSDKTNGNYVLNLTNVAAKQGDTFTVSLTDTATVQFELADESPATQEVTVQKQIVTFDTLIANDGESGVSATTELELSLGDDYADLTADDITLTGATLDAVAASGLFNGVYTLEISDITVADGEEVNVTLEKGGVNFDGVDFDPAERSVAVKNTPLQFTGLTANGKSGETTTDLLTLTFSSDVPGLAAGDITVTGATKGALTKVAGETGKYTLAISNITVANGANVTVEVAKASINFNPPSKTVAVYLKAPTYTVSFSANGGSVTPASATTGTNGKLASLPTPTRSGYNFSGWFTAASGGTAVTTNTVFTQNSTIYAQWTLKPVHDPVNPPDPTKPVDNNNPLTLTFQGEYKNMVKIILNGHELTITPTSATTANLSGYPGSTGVIGTLKSGSVIITYAKEFLATLPNGTHTQQVTFNDGGELSTGSLTFLVQQATSSSSQTSSSSSETSSSSSETSSSSSSSSSTSSTTAPAPAPTPGGGTPSSPQTGDMTSNVIWLVLAGVALLAGGGALVVVLHGKKKNRQQ